MQPIIIMILLAALAACGWAARHFWLAQRRLGSALRAEIAQREHSVESLRASEADARQTLERVLHDNPAHLRSIIENLPVMVNALDENGQIVIWNRECERVTGYTAEEVVGQPEGLALIYPDADYLHHIQAIYRQIGGDFRDWELALTAKDGTERIVAWSNVSQLYPIPGWRTWAIGVDITRRKQTEKALYEAHEALEQRVAERTAALRVTNETLQREIAERRRAESALKSSQAQLRMMIDALADAVHVVDRDLRITLFNEAFRQMNQELGLETNAIGRTPFDLFPFLPSSVRDEYNQVIATGQLLLTHETNRIGSVAIYSETRKIPVMDGDRVTHVVTVIRDVTEQRRAEQALQQSERDYRGLFESAHDAIIVFDPDGEMVLDVNQRACEIYGYSRDELIGLSLEKLSRDIPQGKRHLDATLTAAGSRYHFETVQYRKDGREMILEINAAVVNFQGRQVILSINRDITDRVQFMQALQQSEERFRTLVSSMDDVVFTLDANQRHTGVYGLWLERSGLPPEAFLNKTAREVLGAEAARPHEQANARALAGERVLYEWSTQTGETTAYYQTLLSPLYNPHGQVIGVVGVGREITDRKRAQQEALELALEKERSAILSRFVQDISHEFANPLSVIKNGIYLALNTPDPARRARHMDLVGQQVLMIEKLVEGLMLMSRLDAGFPFRCEPTAINRLIQTACENLEAARQDKRHQLITELAAHLSPAKGDPRLLYVAIRHLVENAIRFTPPDGTITIRTAQRGEHIVVEVQDTGVGIADENRDKIFQRFFRVERSRTERGAGLGLPIAQSIIERHGGRIEVESEAGVGSTFRVFLPFDSC
jgi:PAS domain S-box-containing protein